MKLFVLRHCERNINDCSFESPLTGEGHCQAMDLCNIINNMKITKIYSSPFLRTIQTGNYYSKKFNVPINIDYSLCEFCLENDKKNMSSIYNYNIPESWYINYNINKKYDKFLNIYNINETLYDCIQRIEKIYNFLVKKYKNTNENILIITHMSIINVFLHIKNQKNLKINNDYEMGKITQII